MTKQEGLMIAGRWLSRSRKGLLILFIGSLLITLYFSTPFFLMQGMAVTIISLSTTLLAFLIRWKAFSVKGFQLQHVVNAGGIYSRIRFPIYLSDLLLVFSLSLFAGVWSYILFVVPVSYMIINRMVLWQENAMANTDENQFSQWAETTTAIFPIKGGGVASVEGQTFSRRLYGIAPTLLLVIITYVAIDVLKSYMITLSLGVSYVAMVALAVALIVYVVSLILKR